MPQYASIKMRPNGLDSPLEPNATKYAALKLWVAHRDPGHERGVWT